MAGCMRGASDSGVNVESGDGKVKKLVVVTSSICSIEYCMMLARAFNSEMASCGTLQKRIEHLISSVNACHTLQHTERWVSLTERTKGEDSREWGTSLNNREKCWVSFSQGLSYTPRASVTPQHYVSNYSRRQDDTLLDTLGEELTMVESFPIKLCELLAWLR
jgi:hypothetical protein